MPKTNRPPESWSRLATHFAVTIGSLGDQTDAGAEQQLLCRRSGKRQSHERIVGVGVFLGQFAAARKRGAPAGRDMGMLRHEQRTETVRFESTRQLADVDAVIGREIEDANPHVVSSPHPLDVG